MSGLPPRKKQQTQTLQNVKVVVRVRPLTKTEKDQNVKNIVKCLTQRDLLIKKDKKYSFDNVFKPESSQIELYTKVVAPLIKDVVTGYNCTVFAYGQTGTGKTYTMTGDKCNPVGNWKEDEDAGIIPRAALHIFEELGKFHRHEINVKVSYMELYNEEIRDLLSNDEKSLQLLTDTKGGLVIPGLTEISVHNSEEICKLLQRGILKRQIAPTLMNHQSSRSHTVFTIAVNTSENTASGDDILKLGKINLVDLAGSENIARSGCKDLRAQELANINRSLLTLGRVIHALADKAQGHIPYRDSKLTRILQDSLGGHTKTIIIATVSPAHTSHEETTSTLEYATRARDIKNTPIINEKLNKNEMIRVLLKEIDNLQKDLDAARTGTGFYVDKENYQRLLDAIMAVTGERITSEELTERKAERLRDLEQYLHNRVREFDETLELCKRHQSELEEAKTAIREKDEHLEQERYLSKWYEEHSSQKLTEAQNLLRAAHTLTSEKELLLAKLEHQFNINVNNETTAQTTVNNLLRMTETFSEQENNFADIQKKYGEIVQEQIRNHKSILEEKFADLKTNASNIDRHRIASFSVHKSLGGITSSKVELIREKISFLEEISKGYRKQNQDFKRWLPKMVEAMKVETEKTINQATKTMERTNDQMKVYNLEVKTYVSLCKNKVKMRKEQAQKNLKLVEDLAKSIKSEIEEDAILENHLEQMTLKVEECDAKNQSEMVGNINRLEQSMMDSIKYVEDMSLSYFNHCDMEDYNSDELVHTVKTFEEEIIAVSYKLDDIYTTVTQEAIDSITQRIESTCESIESILDDKIKNLLTKIETMVKSTVAFDDTYRHFAVNIKEALVKQILEKNIPARHAGDTPCRQSITYPTNLEQMAPREALLEKFKVQLPKKEDSSLFENDDSDEDF